ncbi:oligosaccharide flippase family protein [Polymorphobacter fuscus]|uniref:oligosaccharide flippase family protein n=1 Tax=Sandarakinorhabdus fusca TaxID=1439888 RepID=UPI00142FBFCE|nr:oligosaccharide flippase family protein [Polymorphobacter fuscus]NJC09944.1 O-antigen/teichoic acid export membrane protein [Polymorphobacter fuscus]
MASVKTNITTNLFAAVWVTVLTAVITPVQINLLGIESYGLIGFIATLQIVFSAFDLGLSSTLTREIAADTSPGRRASSELIRTASTVYWGLAAAIALTLGLSAATVARLWFNAEALASDDLASALYLIIAYLALRWPIALYSGILAGLHRLDIVNLVKVITATLRNISGIIVIFIWRDVHAFLWCLAANALIEIAAYWFAALRAYHTSSFGFGISGPALRSVWKFSLNMGAISVLALIISQLDRLMASKLLPLDQFGYYSLAYNTAAVATIASAAISSAMLPSFSALQAPSDRAAILRRYADANRVILYVMGLATFPLIFFGDAILRLWIGPAAAQGAYPAMAILALAFWVNGIVSNPYNIAVAMGRPDIPLRVSAFSAVPYAVLLWVGIGRYGGPGAAGGWLILMVAYVAALIPVVHARLLDIPIIGSLRTIILPFGLLGVGSFGLPWLVIRSDPSFVPTVTSSVGALTVAVALYVSIGYWLVGESLRSQFRRSIFAIRNFGGRHA